MLNILTKIITTFSDLIYTISEWESKGRSTEKFMCTYMTNVGVCPRLILMNDSRIRLKLKRSCLKQAHKAPFTPKNVVNLIIAYDLGTSSWNINTDFPWKDSLFGSVELTKNADPDKCKYNGYGIGFDYAQNGYYLVVAWVKMSLFLELIWVHLSIAIITKDTLILGKRPTWGLDDNTSTAEVQYSIIFSRPTRQSCLNSHYNGSKRFLFVNTTKIYQFKANDSEINKYFFYLGNISKNFAAINMKKRD